MRKFLGVLTMVILGAAAACSTGLSLDDYAEECGEWQEDYSDYYSLRDAEDALEDWEAIKPPSEVERLHDLRTSSLKLAIQFWEKQEELDDELDDLRDEREDARRSERGDIDDEMDDLRDDFDDEMEDLQDEAEDLQDEAEDEWDDLSRRVRRDLEREGCDLS